MTWTCPECSRLHTQPFSFLLEIGDCLWTHCPDCQLEHRCIVDEDMTLLYFGPSRKPQIYGKEDFSWRR